MRRLWSKGAGDPVLFQPVIGAFRGAWGAARGIARLRRTDRERQLRRTNIRAAIVLGNVHIMHVRREALQPSLPFTGRRHHATRHAFRGSMQYRRRPI